MKIDCSLTENYLKELIRAKKDSWTSTKVIKMCTLQIVCEPNDAIKLLQKWSDAHQQKTYLEDLLEKFPKIKLNDYGLPTICPWLLGYQKEVCPKGYCNTDNSRKCWNQIMEEEK